ncbi:DsbA family oxidoreductase [Leminorella grimontii]|uniref:DsbA family oxidoreductase n=1 Tax=Leminorella grimontii TaxID=82981 RepID=UPI00208812BD|nr:DsbA family oxidoreductase [Leminorella grimontii]GKX60431.1 DSBA oxidoreductase [Leminorella grimontii]
MKIQMWSDFSCPFCYIGKQHLKKALSACGLIERAEIVFRSFELDPRAVSLQSGDIYRHLSEKYDMGIMEVKEMTEQIARQGAIAGLSFRFDRLIPTNTFDAHRLLHFAAGSGSADAVGEALFYASFTEGRNLSDRRTLVELGQKAGLNVDVAREMLVSDRYGEAVRADEGLARQLKITSVPFFIFDNKYAVSGAQPVDVFSDVLVTVEQEAQRLGRLNGGSSHQEDAFG